MPEYEEDEVHLTRRQIVSLEAIADDAVQHATSAVAQLLGITLEISAAKAHSVPASDVTDLVGDPEDMTVAIYLKVDGHAPGHAAFLCPLHEALNLVDILSGNPPGTAKVLDEYGASALQELGNILTSSYLNSLSEHTGFTFLPHPPQLAVDMAYALVTTLLVGTVQGSLEALSIVTEFGHESRPFEGHFVYIPESQALPLLLGHKKEAA